MKICPRCQKTYSDDNLNFCLEDGSVLAQAGGQPPQTVFINNPQTQPQQTMPSQPGSQPAWNTAPQQYPMQPKKSSKTWIWVLLILGALVLLCGGGLLGFLAYIGSQADKAANSLNKTTNTAANKGATNANTAPTSDRTSVDKLDLSKWVQTDQSYGTTSYTDGELLMASKKKTDYFALAGTAKQISTNADSRLTVRNVANADTDLGYGLIFHSDPAPLKQGYALLIDSKKKRYRVVHHTPHNEDPIVKWTQSDAILDGTQANILEVRDKTDGIDIYINGTKVNTIKNMYGYPNGVVGLYVGGGIQVAFKDLEIHK